MVSTNKDVGSIGLEVLASRPTMALPWGRCGLLYNQASVTKDWKSAPEVCHGVLGKRLCALFGPQHGATGTLQDNMVETPHATTQWGLPVYSLYSETRAPTASMLDGIDTLIVDLQNVGCRVYTFKWTLMACLKAAREHHKRVVVLDRMNPLGGMILEGPVLSPESQSFVGGAPMPMRHGLTMGELALWLNLSIGAELEVIPVERLRRADLWPTSARPWVYTSPNLPTFDAVAVYPGMVLFEGTNVSEGRGTTLPFQLIGAPYIPDSHAFVLGVIATGVNLAGIHLRPVSFQPTFHKWQGQECRGVHVHVTDPSQIRSFALALALIKVCIEQSAGAFAWKHPPYEYEYTRMPIELILGTSEAIAKTLTLPVSDLFWDQGHHTYEQSVQPIHLYP